MKIEIYGIPATLHNCWGCVQSVKLLEREGIPYEFHAVLVPSANDIGFDYDRPVIESLAKRVGSRSLKFQYPRIFVDGNLIGGYRELLELIGD